MVFPHVLGHQMVHFFDHLVALFELPLGKILGRFVLITVTDRTIHIILAGLALRPVADDVRRDFSLFWQFGALFYSILGWKSQKKAKKGGISGCRLSDGDSSP